MMKRKRFVIRVRTIIAQIKMLVSYFQIVVSFMSFGYSLPASYMNVITAFDFVNLNPVSNLRALCVGDLNFFNLLVWQMVMPFGVTCIICLHYLCSVPQISDGSDGVDDRRRFKSGYWNFFCMLLFMIYPECTRLTIGIFSCKPIMTSSDTARYFMNLDLTIECYTSEQCQDLILTRIPTQNVSKLCNTM